MDVRERTSSQVAGLTVTEWPGEPPTVVGLPGLGSSALTWEPIARNLAGQRFLSVDLRGRGASRHLTGEAGLRGHARDVAAVLTDLDLTDVTLVGHSMGAYLAPLVAREAPDRIRRMVLVDGGIRPAFPFFMGPALTRFAFRKDLRAMDRWWPDVETMMRKRKVGRMVATRPELAPLVAEMLEAECERGEQGIRPRVDIDRCVDDAVDTLWGADTRDHLADVMVPTEILLAENLKWDGQRPFIADKAVERWRDQPLITVRRLPGNHVTVLFAPEVAEALRQ